MFKFGDPFAAERPQVSISRAYIFGDKDFWMSANQRAGFGKRGHVTNFWGPFSNSGDHFQSIDPYNLFLGPIF